MLTMCRNIQWAFCVGVPHSPIQPSPDQTYGGEKCDLVADGYYVVRPMIAVVNTYRLFPCHYCLSNIHITVYIAFTLYYVL